MLEYNLKTVEDFDWKNLMALEWGQGGHARLVPNTAGKDDDIPGTMFMLLKSETRLYFKFMTIDRNPKSTLTDYNAPLYDEEALEIFVSPNGGAKRYFEFQTNHLGAVFAAWIDNGAPENRKINYIEKCPVELKVMPTPKGFITFGHINITDWNISDGATFNVYRIKRSDNNGLILGAYSPTGADNFHMPEKFAKLKF